MKMICFRMHNKWKPLVIVGIEQSDSRSEGRPYMVGEPRRGDVDFGVAELGPDPVHHRGGREVGRQALAPHRLHDALTSTEIGKRAWRFAKLQPGRARKRSNAT